MSITAPWTCGHCFKENTAAFNEGGRPTFVERCSRCRHVPNALACRRCGQTIVFDTPKFNEATDEIAFLTGFPPVPVEIKDTLEERRERIKRAWQ